MALCRCIVDEVERTYRLLHLMPLKGRDCASIGIINEAIWLMG